MIKKILAIFLSFTFLFSVSSLAEVKKTAYTYDDVIISLSDEMLSLTGVSELLEIDNTKEITRADFIYALGILLKWPSSISETIPYKDVPKDAVYLPALCSGLKLGYLSEADAYNGSSSIKLTEAVKLAVSAAGYRELANVKGGYPAGYLTCARDAEILNYINIESEFLSGADFKILMYNTMTCAYMYETSFGGSVGYENETGKNLLGDIHNLYMYEGLVTATPGSRLTNSSSIADGKIEIEGTEYNSKIDSFDLLGFNVIGFYEKSSVYTILSAVKVNNTIVEIAGIDLDSYPPSSNRLGVWDGDKVSYYNLKTGYNFIYNGKSYPGHGNAYYGNDFIDLTIVDNNDDGVFDVVFANEYKYYTIGELSDLSYRIVDSMGINGYISLESAGIKVYATGEDGMSTEWYNLTPSSVVAALISKDNMLIKLRTLTEVVSGTVDEINVSEGTIVIDGNSYRASSYLNSIMGSVNLAASYSFTVDGDVLISPSNRINTEMYGYIADCGTTTGIDAAVQVQMLRDNGKLESLNLADKLQLNGTLYSNSDPLVNTAINTRQLVKYKLNADNEINFIKEADLSGQNPFDNKSDEYTGFRKFEKKYTNAIPPVPIEPRYKSGTATFLPYCCVKNTTFFVVPGDAPTVPKEDIYSVCTYSSIGFSNNDEYDNVEFYDISSQGMCAVAVYKTNDPLSTITTDSSVALVEKITSAVNGDGEIVSRVYLLTEKGYAAYLTDEKFNINSVGCASGDVIRFAVDKNGTIIDAKIDFDLDTGTHYDTFNSWTTNAELAYILSRLYSYENGYAYLEPVSSVPDTTTLYYTWDSLKYTRLQGEIVVYNLTTGKARYGTAADFKTYKDSGTEASYVLAKTNKYIDGEFIIIYEQ